MRPANGAGSDVRWIRAAIRFAIRSNEKHRHGCVIVAGGRIITGGRNRRRLDPEYHQVPGCMSWHAEVSALRRYRGRAPVTLYVARVSRTGELRLSAPCGHCTEAIARAGVVREVVYSV